MHVHLGICLWFDIMIPSHLHMPAEFCRPRCCLHRLDKRMPSRCSLRNNERASARLRIKDRAKAIKRLLSLTRGALCPPSSPASHVDSCLAQRQALVSQGSPLDCSRFCSYRSTCRARDQDRIRQMGCQPALIGRHRPGPKDRFMHDSDLPHDPMALPQMSCEHLVRTSSFFR